jgi:hypothetical protein
LKVVGLQACHVVDPILCCIGDVEKEVSHSDVHLAKESAIAQHLLSFANPKHNQQKLTVISRPCPKSNNTFFSLSNPSI